MTITKLSSQEFNQGVSEARRAANHGPVFITEQGRPAHVLISMEHYQGLTESRQKIADLLAMPGIEEIELEIPRVPDLAQVTDFC